MLISVKDIINLLPEMKEAFEWIAAICIMWMFYRGINSGENDLRWWHFISVKGADGKDVADINKLGQVVGIGGVIYVVMKLASNAHTDYTGFALVLGACLGFLAGPAGYSAYLRSRSGRIETTTTVEPAKPADRRDADAGVKTTTTSSVPAATPGAPAPAVSVVVQPTAPTQNGGTQHIEGERK